MAELSPMMQHYMEKKEEYKDCILFYRLGDFYEMFFDDAITASRELEITLTGNEIFEIGFITTREVRYHHMAQRTYNFSRMGSSEPYYVHLSIESST